MSDSRPIGVFDSGVGGLTVARAIRERVPDESLIYVGDAAHFPYGPKPIEEIRGYALEIAAELVRRDVKLLVVACNSIEVSAIGDIATAHGVPVVGVINPGARAAAAATRNGIVGVIGTVATIQTGAYQRAIGSSVELHAAACPAFVEFVELGDTSSDELREAAQRYLAPLRERGIDTLILGCTHYPLLADLLQEELGPGVVLVSSAEETAKDVAGELDRTGRRRVDAEPPASTYLTTGDPAPFRRLAQRFGGAEVAQVGVLHIDAGARA
ncbi:MAG TPA: glutamate racemase [Actinomycetota bacterium]|nr:glutamate racemase [Actinomycetota bacterium]